MKDYEVRVHSPASEKTGPVAERSFFDMPMFNGDWFNLHPFAVVRRLAGEIDRGFHASFENGPWLPTVEIKEEADSFRVSAELPGLKPEDVRVHVTEDAVILEGERTREKNEKREGFYRSERSYGSFYRTIPLPKGADSNKASAGFANGMLEIKIPVSGAKPKSREVPVKHAA
jgi:HSP20 family protein